MIAKTPFPLTDLAEARAGSTCENSQGKSLNQDGKTDIQHCRSMEFKSIGPGRQKASEPDRLYTEDDLVRAVDDARRAAALETEAAVRLAMVNDIEQRRCDMLAAIKNQLERHESAFEDELDRLATVSHRLALALAKAVIPRAIECQPLVDITDVLKVTIASLVAVPAIELRLHPSQAESGEVLMAGLIKDVGFAGEVTTVPDPALGEGDAELRWLSGAISRRLDLLQDEALELASYWLQQRPETDDGSACTSLSVSLELEVADGLPDQVNDVGSTDERAMQ